MYSRNAFVDDKNLYVSITKKTVAILDKQTHWRKFAKEILLCRKEQSKGEKYTCLLFSTTQIKFLEKNARIKQKSIIQARPKAKEAQKEKKAAPKKNTSKEGGFG